MIIPGYGANDVSAPTMIVDTPATSSDSSAWTFEPMDIVAAAPPQAQSPADYCNKQYENDPAKKAACLALPGIIKPWTLVGKALTSSGAGSAATNRPPNANVKIKTDIFGIPDTVFYVGAGMLAIGSILYLAKRRQGAALSSYKRRRRRRR